jgi:heme exporter protein A
LLDEPTVSLDVASVALFADAVRRHVSGGGAALIATHIDLGLKADTFDIGLYKADPNAKKSTAGGDRYADFDEAFS